IFDHLYQEPNHDAAGRKGLGLGLFICEQIVSRQGGKIWVDSIPAQGSSFFVTLPVYSLYGLVASPIVRQVQTPQSLGLITVRIKGGRSKQPPAEFYRAVSRTIESCVMPNLDALITLHSPEGLPDRFFILAVANEEGMQVLGRRMGDQLKRNHDESYGRC